MAKRGAPMGNQNAKGGRGWGMASGFLGGAITTVPGAFYAGRSKSLQTQKNFAQGAGMGGFAAGAAKGYQVASMAGADPLASLGVSAIAGTVTGGMNYGLAKGSAWLGRRSKGRR